MIAWRRHGRFFHPVENGDTQLVGTKLEFIVMLQDTAVAAPQRCGGIIDEQAVAALIGDLKGITLALDTAVDPGDASPLVIQSELVMAATANTQDVLCELAADRAGQWLIVLALNDDGEFFHDDIRLSWENFDDL